VLGLLATAYARRTTGKDLSIFYDDLWWHRTGNTYFPDYGNFRYDMGEIQKWGTGEEVRALDNSRDYWFHLYQPRPGDTILDIGAGIGTDTEVFSQAAAEAGRVLAVEAHPLCFRVLEKRIARNELENVTPIHAAIMDKLGSVFIEDRGNHEANAVSTKYSAGCLDAPVRAMTLDSLCRDQRIERIDLLKMNIEGAERFALEGMKEIVDRTRYACVACHDFLLESGEQFCTRDLVCDFFRKRGFNVVTRSDDSRIYVRDHVHAVRA
jgi:FkbM family methyltransferase